MSQTRPDIDVHPKNLEASALQKKIYDVVVIGGGPTGEVTAEHLSRGGLSTLLVEAELVGGECHYWACVPSKALLRAAETIESAKAVNGARQRISLLSEKYGVPAKPTVDLEGVWERRDMVTDEWKDDPQVKAMQSAGVEVVHGFGRLSGPKKVAIKNWHSGQEVEVEAKQAVVIATGSAPVIPKIDGLDESKYWTPRDAVSSREVPEHLIILGGGAVGTEMATFYDQVGSKVTLISNSVLSKLVPEAREMVAESLVKAGVDVKLGVKVTKVNRIGKSVTVSLSDNSTVEGTEILVAAGRKARTSGMTLDTVGAGAEGRWIEVDDSMCATAIPDGWLYVAGDTNGRGQTTHIGTYQSKIVSSAIIAKSKGIYEREVKAGDWKKVTMKSTGRAIAQVIFTDPQVAMCGLTPAQAAAEGITTRSVSVKMSGPGTMLHADGYEGWAQWVIDGQERLVGATYVGRDVVDLLHASTMAIVGKMTLEQIWHATPPFPTMSEVYTVLSEAAEKPF